MTERNKGISSPLAPRCVSSASEAASIPYPGCATEGRKVSSALHRSCDRGQLSSHSPSIAVCYAELCIFETGSHSSLKTLNSVITGMHHCAVHKTLTPRNVDTSRLKTLTRENFQSETARPANTRDNQMVRGKLKNVSNRN